MPVMPLLSFTIFSPLLGCLFLSMIRGDSAGEARNAKSVALSSSLLTLILTILLWVQFDSSKMEFQLVEMVPWLPDFSYTIGLDGLALSLMLLTAFLVPVAILASWESIRTHVAGYMVAILFLELLLLGAFSALDLLLFYVFFEGSLIPLFFIIGMWGGEKRRRAAFKFFLYTLLGSVFLLLALLYLNFLVGTLDYRLIDSQSIPLLSQLLIFGAFLLSCGIKLPLWPLHTWLPLAHVEAPTGGSILLAGILLKLGGYGLARFAIPLFPEAAAFFAPWMGVLGLMGLFYTSLIALVQVDMKKLIAYSSVAHMGLVVVGLFSLNAVARTGALFQLLAHGVTSAGLFLGVGILYSRLHTRFLSAYGNVMCFLPGFSVCFLIFGLGAMALPGTGNFLGEFLILVGTWQANPWMTALAVSTLVLSTTYTLWLLKKVLWGMPDEEKHAELAENLTPLSWREWSALLPLGAMILILGLYPMPFVSLVQATPVLQPTWGAPLAKEEPA